MGDSLRNFWLKTGSAFGVMLVASGCLMVDEARMGEMTIQTNDPVLEALLSETGNGTGNPADTPLFQPEDTVDDDPAFEDDGPVVEDSPNPQEDEGTLCLVECDGRVCGDNGCGGVCGVCDDGLSCSGAGQCEPPALDCTPQCFRNTCGDDGCGGQCGDCVDGSACAVYQNHSNPSSFKLCEADSYTLNDLSPSCPPDVSDMGTDVGDVVPEVALLECDTDYPVNHLGMCGHTLSIVYQINVNCGPCIGYVNSVLGPLQAEFSADGVQFYVVYTQAQECETQRYFRDGAEQISYVYQPIRHLYSHLFGTGGRASTLILSDGNRIEYYGKGDGTDPNGPSSEMLRGYIEAALSL